MSKVRILSPRPENSNRRKCGGFNFFGDACGFKRQTAVCRGSNLSLDLSSKDDKSACILVFMRTARGLFFIYSDSPRLKFAACAENVGFYIQKCTICDLPIAEPAQISDMAYTA